MPCGQSSNRCMHAQGSGDQATSDQEGRSVRGVRVSKYCEMREASRNGTTFKTKQYCTIKIKIMRGRKERARGLCRSWLTFLNHDWSSTACPHVQFYGLFSCEIVTWSAVKEFIFKIAHFSLEMKNGDEKKWSKLNFKSSKIVVIFFHELLNSEKQSYTFSRKLLRDEKYLEDTKIFP